MISNVGNIDWDDDFSFYPQIFCFLILIYFTIRSIFVVIQGFKNEHKEQGIIPVLAYVYMLFSVFFTIRLILNFGELSLVNRNVLQLSTDGISNNTFYLGWFNPVFACVLIAFTANFCKSFFTMNSLEFGFLNGMKYGTLFKNKSSIHIFMDSLFRLLAAFFFINIEHSIGSAANYSNANLFPFITNIGIQAILLYGCVLVWLLYNWIFLSDYTVIKKAWYTWTLFQFIGGLALGVSLLLFGSQGTTDNYKETVLMVSWPIMFGTFAIIICIVAVEILSLRDRTTFTTPHTPLANGN